MSHGPGKVERQIASLFRETGDARSFTVADLCVHVFGDAESTRSQRVSVLRAAHRVLKRIRDVRDKNNAGMGEAYEAAVAKFGEPAERHRWSKAFTAFYDQHPALKRPQLPYDRKLGAWRATELLNRTIVFHHGGLPVRVWAVRVALEGVIWADTEIVRVTDSRVTVRYQGELAPVPRLRLDIYGSWYRGVCFLSARDQMGARNFERQWQEKYGHLFTARMPLEDARLLLGLPVEHTKDDIIAAFRRAAKCCHPDMGGTAEQFQALVKARDRLLAAIGSSAPPPKMPTFAPKGTKLVYRAASARGAHRLGGATARLN